MHFHSARRRRGTFLLGAKLTSGCDWNHTEAGRRWAKIVGTRAEEKMSDKNPSATWTGTQAYVLSIICLIAGIAIGYLVRGSASPAVAQSHVHESESSAPGTEMRQQPTPEQMK